MTEIRVTPGLLRILRWLDSFPTTPDVIGDITTPRNENEAKLLLLPPMPLPKRVRATTAA